MADFPALEPDSRRYSLGQFPVTTETGFGAGSVRFLHGTVSSGHTLELGFLDLSQANAKLLRDHYRTQQGGFLPFALSAEAWAGHASSTDLVPSTTQWKYNAQPEETHKRGGFVDVTVQLVSVIS
jgi:hypothetical protein